MSKDEIESLKQRAQLYASKDVAGMLIAPHHLLNLLEDLEITMDQLEDLECQVLDLSDLQDKADEAVELEKDLVDAEKDIDALTEKVATLERDNQVMSKALTSCRCGGGA